MEKELKTKFSKKEIIAIGKFVNYLKDELDIDLKKIISEKKKEN